jgi:CBS domain-containing protein
MKIKDLMTSVPRVGTLTTNAAEAAALMLDGDCGILPIVDDGKLVGVVTDRDLFIALATRNTRPSELTMDMIAQGPIHACEPDDDVQVALQLMQRYRIRRVPVTGFGGTVLGIVSLNDIVLAVGAANGIRPGEAVQAMQAICAHHHPAPQVTAA